jgi:GxxExxY protein
MLSRAASTLTDAEEGLVTRVIGCFIAVHRALWPGMSETVYSKASAIELHDRGIAFELEKAIPISYKGRLLCHHRIDLLIAGKLVVEIKTVEAIHTVHVAQVVSYLRATGGRVGLLINFNVEVLRDGIRRVVV